MWPGKLEVNELQGIFSAVELKGSALQKHCLEDYSTQAAFQLISYIWKQGWGVKI